MAQVNTEKDGTKRYILHLPMIPRCRERRHQVSPR
jgi:hypothetical protein